MPSKPLLDIEALIAPLAGNNPAGDAEAIYPFRDKWTELRREEDPDNYGLDDPMRSQLKRADWRGIIRLASDTLTRQAKDLEVTARLVEALTKEHGFAGVRDGLRLLRLLVDQGWDRVYPVIEDGDLEVRADRLNNLLDAADRGTRFPVTLRRTPLVAGDGKAYGWLDWRASQDAKGSITKDDWDSAVEATKVEDCKTAAEDLAQAREELNQLGQVLAARMGSHAPGLLNLRQALDECHTLIGEIVRRKSPDEPSEPHPPNETADLGEPGKGSGPAQPRSLASREDAYRQLEQAAALLQKLEPHSPIPIMIQRAVELGKLKFPDLLKALIADDAAHAEVWKLLGHPRPPSAE